MKKSLVVILGILLMVVFIGCSKGSTPANTSSANTDSEIQELKNQIATLQEENSTLKRELNTTSSTTNNTVSSNSTSSTNSDINGFGVLKYNQSITINGVCTFSITSAKFTTKVVPSKPSDLYTYYQVKDTNNIYIDIVLKYKNLFSSGKRADEVGDIKVKYDDQYDYTSFSAIEEKGGGDLTYTNITDIDPLTTSTLHYICEVPKEVQTSSKSVIATITIDNQDYQLKIK